MNHLRTTCLASGVSWEAVSPDGSTFYCYMVSIVYGAWHEGGWQPTKMVRRYRSRQTSAALFAGCRAVWRQIWPLQGRCSAVTLAPLLMVLLLLIASSCLQAYCFLLAWFQTRTGIIQKLQFSICICYIGAADTGWHWLEEVWSKFCILIIQSFAVSVEKLGSVL